jgi:diguanylate cyclase (GGDEF)-like protein
VARISQLLRTGLQTRVASRTFLLFVVCAALPTLLFALLGWRMVSAELRQHAAQRLVGSSKGYGLLLYSRLREADAILTALAEEHLQRNLPLQSIRHFATEALRIIEVSSSSLSAERGAITHRRELSLRGNGQERQVQLQITVQRDSRLLSIRAEVPPEFLWDTDAVELQAATLCVFDAAGRPLHCSPSTSVRAEQESPLSTAVQLHALQQDRDMLHGEWDLFLQPWQPASQWTVRAYQPARVAHAALHRFSAALPVIATLATVCALLLSSVQIRRSHQPLAVLIRAARRIGRMRFNRPIHIDSGDEYARLGNAFNRMGTRLRYQFMLLSTLGRIDRLILSRHRSRRAIARLVLKLPRLLRCEVAGVLTLDPAGTAQLVLAQQRQRRLRTLNVELGNADIQQLAESEGLITVTAFGAWAQALADADIEAVQAAAIRVKSELRGFLLLGYPAGRRPHRYAARYAAGIAHRLAVAFSNEQHEQALVKQAYFDPLTGLPNRMLFKDRLQQELTRAKARGTTGALLFIDVDRFKNVNDSLGHSVGDELLQGLANRFRQLQRDSDTLARLGGDEFTLIAPETDAATALQRAEALLASLQQPVRLRDIQYVADASIGIAMFPRDGDTAEVLLRNADLAMYRAKATARGQTQFFEESMNQHAARRLDLEQRLRVALARDELSLVFQPIVRAGVGSVIGVEALARWPQDDGSSISPSEFIPIAEETGLVAQVGTWSMRAACEALRSWREQRLAIEYVAVNVSIRQLNDPGFIDKVKQCLAQNALPPHSLEIEVTETVLAENPATISAQLSELQNLGVRLAIDDFGTGYSSMAMLRHLQIDVLKIDQSFVRDCAVNDDARALLNALIAAGHALKKTVVAEGVEQIEQRAVLESLGCDRLQGYLFAKPMSRRLLTEYLVEHTSKQLTPVNAAAETESRSAVSEAPHLETAAG